MDKPITKLEFSDKYTREHAANYLRKHKTGLARRLSNWRETQIAREALIRAGRPRGVLDLPCGAGRFWPLLAEQQERTILGADYSRDMIAVAVEGQAPSIVKRVSTLQTSAFSIDLEENAVDCVFSMRLMHHIGRHEDRMQILREFHRVSRDSVIISLWVDGNYKAWREVPKKRKKHEGRKGYQNRFVIPRKTIEEEFTEAGFTVDSYVDFIPLYSMWRIYIIRK